MSLQEYFNSSCCICTSNLNSDEIYFILFDYPNNSLYKLLNNENKEVTINTSKRNNRIYFNVSSIIDLEYDFNSKEMIENYVRKYYKKVYCFFLDKETNDIYFSFIENEKESVLLGVLFNSPNLLKLNENETINISNFLVAGVENVFETVEELNHEFNNNQDESSENEESAPVVKVKAKKVKKIKEDSEPKVSYNKKSKPEPLDNEASVGDSVEKAIEILYNAIEKDKECIKNKIPAVYKLKILPYLIKLLNKQNVSSSFLQKDGLHYLEEFLKKNPDGSFQCFNQMSKVLDIINDLPIIKEHLEDSNILNTITSIEKSLYQNKLIQIKAKNLSDKLIRITNGLRNNFSIEAENEIYTSLFLSKKRNNESSSGENGKIIYEKLNEKRMVPQKSLFDFTFNPHPKDIPVTDDERMEQKNFFKPIKKGVSVKKTTYSYDEL